MLQTETVAPTTRASLYLHRIPRPLLIALVSLLPALATALLLFVYLRVDLAHFLPLNPNDQVYYWHQILTFSEVGYNGGYYVVNEVPPMVSAFRFSAAGPFYPALYGTLARFTGWQPYTGILFNGVLLTLAAALFLLMTRFDHVQIALSGLVMLGVTPVLLYLPSLMQEPVHQAAALILAGVFYQLYFRQEAPSLRYRLLVGAFIVALSFIRFSWAFTLLPFLFLSSRKGSRRDLLLALAVTALVTLGVLVIFQRVSAPGNNSIFGRLGNVAASPLAGLRGLLGIVHFNIRAAFLGGNDEYVPSSGTLIHFEYLLLLIAAYLGCFGRARRRLRPPSGTRWAARWEMLFHLYNLGGMLLAALVFYLPSGYHRVFAPYLLISLLLLVAFKRYRWITVFLAASVVAAVLLLADYRHDHGVQFRREQTIEQLDRLRAAVAPHLAYQAEADPWCNTVLLPVRFLHYQTMAVPAGIGVSFYRHEGPAFPLKSHYLMLGDAEYEELADRLRVERLAEADGVTLYRNLDADCQAPPSSP